MKHSATPSQYVIQPPSFPDFIFKRWVSPYRKLMAWAKEEYNARLEYCASRGYFKQHAYLTRNSSPIRILAEVSGYRRFCSLITQEVWDQFTPRERVFIRRAFEMRDFLLKS